LSNIESSHSLVPNFTSPTFSLLYEFNKFALAGYRVEKQQMRSKVERAFVFLGEANVIVVFRCVTWYKSSDIDMHLCLIFESALTGCTRMFKIF
jgi:hypothetical protein